MVGRKIQSMAPVGLVTVATRWSMAVSIPLSAVLSTILSTALPGVLFTALPADAMAVTHSHARAQHATAASSGLNVPQVQVWTRNTIRYNCDRGRQLTVRYSNTKNEQSFALLQVKGRDMLFVNVLSGSGAKYVAGSYSWWTKGPEGDLRDETADPKSEPLLANCKARP